jgi:D-2-hydroxyacid dehydrogenase (NADP+)
LKGEVQLLIVSTVKLNSEQRATLINKFPGLELVVAEDVKAHEAILAQAEVLITFSGAEITTGFLNKAKNLRWIQTFLAGVDRLPLAELKRQGVVLSNVSGVHGMPMTEQAFAYILAFVRLLPRFSVAQRRHDWDQPSGFFAFESLSGKTLTVIGTGRIGQEVARLGQAFGMRTVGVNTSGKAPLHFQRAYPTGQIKKALSMADFAVVVVPFTAQTQNLIGSEELAVLKPTAYLVNLARGTVIDEQALIKALKRQKLAGAGLDVFSQEPLPPESPLWDLPNVIITPHIGGWSANYYDRCFELFVDNLERYRTGQRLLTQIDLDKGY